MIDADADLIKVEKTEKKNIDWSPPRYTSLTSFTKNTFCKNPMLRQQPNMYIPNILPGMQHTICHHE